MTATMPYRLPPDEYEAPPDATTPAVFRTILAVCSEPGNGRSVVPVAAGSADAVEIARRLLDAGTAVLAVPPWQGRQPRLAHIGIAYDGRRPADAAFEIARNLADAGRGEVARLEIAYVDDPAPCEPGDETLIPRRAAMIEWWLRELGRQVSAPVRPVRLIGDPAAELAQHSRGLDLLVVGARGGSFLRHALTGSVSSSLIATTRCPLLIVPQRRLRTSAVLNALPAGAPRRVARRRSGPASPESHAPRVPPRRGASARARRRSRRRRAAARAMGRRRQTG